MENIIPFEIDRLVLGGHPALFLVEIFARIIIIYIYTLFLMRITGKRGHGQLTLLELLMIISLGSAVGDVMFYPDVPITFALVVVTVVVGLEWVSARVKLSTPWLEWLINDKPEILIKDGKILRDVLRRENLSEQELFSMLREKGVEHAGQVRRCYLELSGHISVFKYENKEVRPGESVLYK